MFLLREFLKKLNMSILKKILSFCLIKFCNYTITDRDIVNCHRNSAKSNTVVVKFLNTKDAVAFLRKNEDIQKLENEENGIDYKNISLNEHLTSYMANLAFKCRCLKRKHKIAKTKVRNGVVNILIDENEGTEWITVLSENEISSFYPIDE